ncbi:hypothetical protein GW17_00053531 [Ensete ventricosum]|nr:hypothetical protein GW17_00053531 [Ensete ventricosum]
MGCRSASLAVHCDIAGPIAAKQRKNERKQSNGYSVSICYVSTGSSGTLEHSRALCLQSRRPLVPNASIPLIVRLEADTTELESKESATRSGATPHDGIASEGAASIRAID